MLPGLTGREKPFMRPHFESIELQDERRQRQPQIIQFFDPGVVPVLHGDFACGLRRALSIAAARGHPVGWNPGRPRDL
jgi:hypothetical protein